MQKLIFKKFLTFNKIDFNIKNNKFLINGIYITDFIILKKNSFFVKNLNLNYKSINLIMKKNFVRSFFSLLNLSICNSNLGFKAILLLKGKGLRMQLKLIIIVI